MADPENFLERWSRRKRDASSTDIAAEPPPQPVTPEASAPTVEPQAKRDPAQPPGPTSAAEPAFDLSKLPSLDSITATTDVRAFLAPGVPPELTRAALRRAWETDPAIRNFVGLQENDWDFNNPTAMAGFGELPPGFDVRQMVSDLFGASERVLEPPATPTAVATPAQPLISEQPQPDAQAMPAAVQAIERPEPSSSTAQSNEPSDIVQGNKNIALHNTGPRKHGGALPE